MDLRAAITAHLDAWGDETPDGSTAEHQVDGYRAALDLATDLPSLHRIATELGVTP